MGANRGAESARDPLEIVCIARHDEVRTRERSGDDNRVDDVASTGARADLSSGTRTRLVEILDAAPA
jgi:hypothetical protein